VASTDRETEAAARHAEHHHADVQGGAARAAVFGVSDGLVSNLGLMLGVAGADPQPGVVRVAGLAGLIAGAISMAAGEYNSMRVQSELLEHELSREAVELRRHPRAETAELTRIYETRGLAHDQAHDIASAVMRDPDNALEVHAREELGINPANLGSPSAAAASSFASFSVGALVPLVPWFVGSGDAAILASLVAGLVCAVVVGAVGPRSTGRPARRAVTRQVAFTILPALVTFAIGNALGVGVS
jgi:vacuolar iron transporter family protein